MIARHLPDAPQIRLELVEDLSSKSDDGFLRLIRGRYVAVYPDGTRSDPFVYDALDRRALDVVVIVAHYVQNNIRSVYLRSAVRPPLALRGPQRLPVAPEPARGALWELPAGLVEASEETEDGVVSAACRELAEEVGFQVDPSTMRRLGPNTFPAPGIVGEQHIYFEVEVDPATRGEPSLDGSALERGGHVVPVTLEQALEACSNGTLPDAKTELALRRLKERFA
jgi:ADP-ribose pyrophosphatase